ncbi:ASPIC/UnbV domain-containing protein [Catenovulum agarivorans DS-2]|uniref:ASPIC/UnbV domain-containing protein n=1 Tax=Catenovulum agarivorans DS-2 TaxID=1328313 RepID=W7QDU2_9ALTE|nr:VCBS repeat-containing protein [Catenovulum agarivorans]EWH10081.1 ASPIC/UnbV domain-containing protein [Catenovulum agarivorans DS-2]
MAFVLYKQGVRLILSVLAILALIMLVLFSIAVWHDKPESYLYKPTISQKINIEPSPLSFADVTLTSGLQHSHIQHTGKISDLIDSLAAGACVGDFDQDNWVDLVFVTGAGQTRYYGSKAWWHKRNSVQVYRNAQGYFRLQPDSFDVNKVSHACAVADFNLDGLPDIVIATQAQDILYQNLGDFQFKPIDTFSQLTLPAWTSHISVADINQDGLPDIHLSHYLKYQKNQKNLEEAAGFTEQHHREFQPQAYDGIQNQVLLNQGDWQFKDISSELGIAKITERTIAAIWLDLNQDDWPDLLEFNSADQAIRGFINQQMSFVPMPTDFLPLTANDSRYASFNNQLNDPFSLLFISRNSGLANLALDIAHLANTPQPVNDISWPLELNQHKYIYQTRWGHTFADFNNDGLSELILTTGNLMPDPFSEQMGLGSKNHCLQLTNHQATEQPAVFQPTNCLPANLDSSRSVIRLDFNNDGKLDILFTNNNAFPQLLLNTSADQSQRNWLNLTIPDNAQIQSLELDGKTVAASLISRQAMFGQHDARLHFGLNQKPSVQVRLKTAKQAYEQTLTANHFYQWHNNQWQIVTNSNTADREPSLTLSALAKLDLTDYLRRNLHKPVHYASLTQLKQASKSANQDELAELVASQPQAHWLALYLYWLETASGQLQQAAATALTQLEAEHSTRYLLTLLDTSDPQTFCATANIFAYWFSQEEAVVRSKNKALPYLFKSIQANNAKIVNCAALALAEAEHHNSSSVIIEAFAKAPVASRARLINTLGKIRQTEARPLLLQRLAKSEDYTEIQQALIALTRLNTQLDNPITQQAAKHNKHVFLALALMPQAIDAIVLEQKQVKHWLAQFNIQYADMPTGKLQKLYLTAAQFNALPLPEFKQFTQANVDPEVYNAALTLLLHKPQAISTPDKLYWLPQILKLNLTKKQLKQLSKNWQADLVRLDVTQLSPQQNNNLVAVFAQLTRVQQQALIKKYQQLGWQSGLSQLQQQALFTACFNHAQTIKTLKITSFGSEFVLCNMLAQSRGSTNRSDFVKQVHHWLDSVDTPEHFHLLSLLALPQQTRTTLAYQRLSAAIITAPNLAYSIKQTWALHQYKQDKFSANWLLQQVNSGNNTVLSSIIRAGDYPWLAAEQDIHKIMQNQSFATHVREKIKSYWLQENGQQEKVQ